MTFHDRREPMTDFYTFEQVAEITGFALRTLQRDARKNKFAHIHRGRTRLMTEEQIEALITQSITGSANGLESKAVTALKIDNLMSELKRRRSATS